MKLERGQIIECVDFNNNDVNHELIDIQSISKSSELGVYDLETETGFFQDDFGIFHKQCSSHSLEYIKKYGLELDNLDSKSSPAKHARTLSVHLNSFLSSMQAYYAGALGVAYVNIMYAPYVDGMSDDEMYQEAQHLIFQASQNAFTRGGQSIFLDFNIHTGIPGYLKNIKAIGPGGKYTGKTYGDYEESALKFTYAMLKVWGEGDATGTPMAFPKCFDKNVNLFARVDDSYRTLSVADLAELYVGGHDISLPHPDGKFVNVTNVQSRPGGEKGFELTLSNNIKLKSLPDHKYLAYIMGEIVEKEVSDLKNGDVLLQYDYSSLILGREFKIDVKKIAGKFTPLEIKSIEECVVDAIAIEVEGDHVFVTANGVVTKNCDFHINEETFKDAKQKKVFDYACGIASKNGVIYFIFDRDEVTLSACCRLRTTINDNYMIDHPESMRFTGFQNVTINLPQCAYRAGKGNMEGFYRELDAVFATCIKAHLDKKSFVSRIMGNPGMPLWQVGKIAKDGRPYIDLDKATYIIGIIGLNECLHYLIGKELHEDESTLWVGIRAISYLYFLAKEAEQKYGLKFSLEESPAESASRRLAKIDLYNFKNDAIVRGTGDQVYYTNSIHLRPDINIDLLTRIIWQAKFHKIIESGAIIHAFVGEKMPSAKSISNMVQKAFKNTDAAQLTISPEFTICKKCGKTRIGLNNSCQYCGAFNVYGVEFGKFTGAEWDVNKLLGK